MTVVFASFSFDAAISVRGVQPGVRCFPLISLEQLACCSLGAVREAKGKGKEEKDLVFAPAPSHESRLFLKVIFFFSFLVHTVNASIIQQ